MTGPTGSTGPLDDRQESVSFPSPEAPAPGGPPEAEHLRFLAAHSLAFLIVNGRSGAPIGYPMTARLFGGALEFNTYRRSAKVGHILRDNRVCAVVVPRDRTAEPRVLAVWGRVSVSDESAEHWIEATRGETSEVGIDVPADVVRQVRERLLSRKRIILRLPLLSASFLEGVRLPADPPQPADQPQPTDHPQPADQPEPAGQPQPTEQPEPAGQPQGAGRPRIAMDGDELAAFLRGTRAMVVAYTGPHGWPMGVLARAEYQPSEIHVEFDAPPDTEPTVATGDTVCCVAEESPSYDAIRGAIVHGTVHTALTNDRQHRWTLHPTLTRSFDFARATSRRRRTP